MYYGYEACKMHIYFECYQSVVHIEGLMQLSNHEIPWCILLVSYNDINQINNGSLDAQDHREHLPDMHEV